MSSFTHTKHNADSAMNQINSMSTQRCEQSQGFLGCENLDETSKLVAITKYQKERKPFFSRAKGLLGKKQKKQKKKKKNSDTNKEPGFASCFLVPVTLS